MGQTAYDIGYSDARKGRAFMLRRIYVTEQHRYEYSQGYAGGLYSLARVGQSVVRCNVDGTVFADGPCPKCLSFDFTPIFRSKR